MTETQNEIINSKQYTPFLLPDWVRQQKEYLESKEQEVVDIMMTLFDDEQILKAYAKDIEDNTARETAERLIKKGKMSLDEIADCVPTLSPDELRELEKKIMQLA